MKFGKRIGFESTPEWRTEFLNYKKLKKIINAHKKAKKSNTNTKNNTPNAENQQQQLSFADLFEKKMHQGTEEQNIYYFKELDILLHEKQVSRKFVKELLAELKKINTFFQKMESKFEEKQKQLQYALTKFMEYENSQEKNFVQQVGFQRKLKLLKSAFEEHYRALVLLQNYRTLNALGFAKILKKFDKNTSNSLSLPFLNLIQEENFFSSPKLQQLLVETEDMFTNKLFKGNRKVAMQKLRYFQTVHAENTSQVFRSGFWLGCDLILIIAWILFYALQYSQCTVTVVSSSSMYLFRLVLFPIILLLFISVNMRIWSKYQINYIFIFELDPRKHLSDSQFLELPLVLLLTWLLVSFGFMVVHVLEDRGILSLMDLSILIPIAYILSLIILILFPFRLLYRRLRYGLLGVLLRIVISPFAAVKFLDFFVADQLTSMTEFLFDIQFLFCYTTAGFIPSVKGFCDNLISFGIPVLNLWPAYARLMQCIRRYKDSGGMFHPHMTNAIKYCTFIVSGLLAFVDKLVFRGAFGWLRVLWIGSEIIGTAYRMVWDFYVDWSLFRFPNSSNTNIRMLLLREKILFPWYWYYLAILCNLLLRWQWVIVLALRLNYPAEMSSEYILFILVLLNIFRRFVWNIFRVENEHVTNCENYRTIREIPLPFDFNKREEAKKRDISTDIGIDWKKLSKQIKSFFIWKDKKHKKKEMPANIDKNKLQQEQNAESELEKWNHTSSENASSTNISVVALTPHSNKEEEEEEEGKPLEGLLNDEQQEELAEQNEERLSIDFEGVTRVDIHPDSEMQESNYVGRPSIDMITHSTTAKWLDRGPLSKLKKVQTSIHSLPTYEGLYEQFNLMISKLQENETSKRHK